MGAQGTRLQSSWHGPFALTRDGIKENVKESPGVYRIPAFDAHGRPVSICRANGVDAHGILHIGQSVGLRGRILAFLLAAQGGSAAHHAGNEFFQWEFGQRFPVEHFRFDYILARSSEYAKKLERELHEAYRLRYLDRPPLDGTSGQE